MSAVIVRHIVLDLHQNQMKVNINAALTTRFEQGTYWYGVYFTDSTQKTWLQLGPLTVLWYILFYPEVQLMMQIHYMSLDGACLIISPVRLHCALAYIGRDILSPENGWSYSNLTDCFSSFWASTSGTTDPFKTRS